MRAEQSGHFGQQRQQPKYIELSNILRTSLDEIFKVPKVENKSCPTTSVCMMFTYNSDLCSHTDPTNSQIMLANMYF